MNLGRELDLGGGGNILSFLSVGVIHGKDCVLSRRTFSTVNGTTRDKRNGSIAKRKT